MNKLETLKCVEVTSQRQADNGTISYYDPQTRTYYNLYENGYVRRSFGRFKRQDGRWSDERIYQLNPVRQTENVFRRHDGGTYTYYGKSRVMLNTHVERMDCAARAVVNYRNTREKYKQQAIEDAANLKSQRINREFRMLMTDIQDSVNDYFEGNLTFKNAINNISSCVSDAKDTLNA